MGGNPETPAAPRQLSPDGLWWWDGARWHPAISPDGLWRWDGQSWVPSARGRRGGAGMAVLITVLVFGGVLVFVSLLTLVILLTMGSQIANVFSNVVAALGS